MAIVKMNKFMLLAFENQKELLLEKLQSFENVEFTCFKKEEDEELDSLRQDSSDIKISNVEDNLSKLDYSIKALEEFTVKKNMLVELKDGKKTFTYDELKSEAESFDWLNVYTEIQQKEKKINNIDNNIEKFKSNIEELRPWRSIDFDITRLKEFKKTKILLGTVPSFEVENLRKALNDSFDDYYFEQIGTYGKDADILAAFYLDEFSDVDQILKSQNFSKVELKCEGTPKEQMEAYEKSVSDLTGLKVNIRKEMEKLEPELEKLKKVYEYYNCCYLRLKDISKFLRSNSIVAIEGYYPTELQKDFESVINSVLGNSYYLETEAADGDDVPVKLKNNKFFESFEDITTMYSVPKYKEIDPTPLLAPFYIIFFGMMLSDAGYGALMLIGTIVALKFFNLDDKMRKTMQMFLYASISTVFWGVMYGSYFGDFLERFITVKALWMKPDSNVTLLMLVSIAIGLVQILVGLGIKGYMEIRDKDYFGAFSDVFIWYTVLIGAILWLAGSFADIIPAEVVTVAKYVTIASMILIVLTNGRNEKSIGAKLAQGLYSLYGITSYAGDLVSYTRLAALGLATGFISYAFNIIIDMVSKTWFTAITFGVAIFIVGHMFNLFINALGSYVHSCRLQYLEYFGKFYEGGGSAFEPLKYNSKYFNVVRDKN